MKYHLAPEIPPDAVWQVEDHVFIGTEAAKDPEWADRLEAYDRDRLLQEQQE